MKTEVNTIKKTNEPLLKEDIVEFLKNKKGGFMLTTFNWWGPLRWRLSAIVALVKGEFTFGEFCTLLSPFLSHTKKLKLVDKFDAFLCQELKKECPVYMDSYVNFLGHKFRWRNYRELITLISQIVIFDQYHTHQFLKNNSIVIDAGANMGIFSIVAARLAPQGRIYSFEPTPQTFDYLQENTRDYPQIVCEKSGLGNEISQKNIFVDQRGTGESVFEDSPFFAVTSRGKENIVLAPASVVTIDAFVAKHDIPRVDFIKIDTEGYEAKILQGAKESIKKFKPVIAMSAYHNQNDKKELPIIVKEFCPEYICELHRDSEEDFICYVKK